MHPAETARIREAVTAIPEAIILSLNAATTMKAGKIKKIADTALTEFSALPDMTKAVTSGTLKNPAAAKHKATLALSCVLAPC